MFSGLLLFCTSLYASDYENKKTVPDNLNADQIMLQVIDRAKLYKGYVSSYDARVYMKGSSRILKKNILMKLSPDFLFLNKDEDQSILETVMDVNYTAPNHFTQNIKAITGTMYDIQDIQTRAAQFMKFNIYNPVSYDENILMPVSKYALKYYRFKVISVTDTLDMRIIKIGVKPKIISQRLLEGTIDVVENLWAISGVDVKGKKDFADYRICVDFGISNKEFLLPVNTHLFLHTKLLGNEVENHYYSNFKYTRIDKYEDKINSKKLGYDLTEYINVKVDSIPVINDSLFWADHRVEPLSREEQLVYEKEKEEQNQQLLDTVALKKRSWALTQKIITPKSFELSETQFRYSGLLNPFKIAYSGLDGFVYWQQLKLRRSFKSGKLLSFEPDVGFVFKRSEVFFSLPVSWLYDPGRMGELSLSMGNRNKSYSSRVIDEIDQMAKDSIFNIDDLDLNYYKNYYLSISNKNELFNGFTLNLSANYLIYDPVKSEPKEDLGEELENEVDDLVNKKYKSFAPSVGITYTFGQYYSINNKRKEYIGSKLPTVSLEYARGIPHLFDSDSYYERIEGDIQQRISLGMLRSFRYYVGAGIFTNTRSIYFADFSKFAKRNFPRVWDEQFGGVFYLLDSKWYNASDSYAQAHLMYEAPFMLLGLMKGISREVVRERFYLGQLYLPALPSYTEFGYVVGNYIFSVGAFFGFEKCEYHSFGLKFNFELGR